MAGAGALRVLREGPVARLTLDRPPLNVLDIALMDGIGAALDALPAPPDVRFLVFRGAGDRAFSAGADVADHVPERVGAMLRSFHRIFRKLWASDWISISAVQGHCLGGGMELAAFCDFVVADRSARFGQPEIQLACFPPVAAAILPALVGLRRATELILTGRIVSAEEAHALGLVTDLAGDAGLDAAVEARLRTLQPLSAAALSITRRSVLRGSGLDFERALTEIEEIYLGRLMRTQDAAEGVRAFLEKRAPAFRGR